MTFEEEAMKCEAALSGFITVAGRRLWAEDRDVLVKALDIVRGMAK